MAGEAGSGAGAANGHVKGPFGAARRRTFVRTFSVGIDGRRTFVRTFSVGIDGGRTFVRTFSVGIDGGRTNNTATRDFTAEIAEIARDRRERPGSADVRPHLLGRH